MKYERGEERLFNELSHEYPEATYYLAHVHYQKKEYDQAATLFQSFIEQDVGFRSDAEFYQILALIMSNQNDLAKQEIKKLLDREQSNKHSYKSSLEELKKQYEQ